MHTAHDVHVQAGTAHEPPVSSAPRMTARVLDGSPPPKPVVDLEALRRAVDGFVDQLYEDVSRRVRTCSGA